MAIKASISELISLDDELKAASKELSFKRARLKALRESVLVWMQSNLPEDEQVIVLPDSGKLVLKKRKKYEKYCQALVNERLTALFQNKGMSPLGLHDVCNEIVERPLEFEEVPTLARMRPRAPKVRN